MESRHVSRSAGATSAIIAAGRATDRPRPHGQGQTQAHRSDPRPVRRRRPVDRRSPDRVPPACWRRTNRNSRRPPMTGPGTTRVTGSASRRLQPESSRAVRQSLPMGPWVGPRAGGSRGGLGLDVGLVDARSIRGRAGFAILHAVSAGRGVDLAGALRHAANMHVIPANARRAARLEAAKPGNVVTMHGRLVDVRGADGFTWKTSLRRDDSGEGACELFWADEIELQ